MRPLNLVAALGFVTGTIACGGIMRAPSASPIVSSAGPPVLTGPMMLRPRHASLVVARPLLSYEGVWSGRSIRRHCSESGGARGVACRVLPEHNVVHLRITQTDSDVRVVLVLGGQRAVLTGRVQPGGGLRLRGSGRSGAYTMNVIDWQATLERGRIHGTFSYVIAAEDERLGSVTLTAALDGLTSAS